MNTIVTRIHFCYGHRLMDYEGKCAHPHGHNGVVEVEVKGDALDSRGLLFDFGELKRRLGEFIEAEIDHRMVLREDDPLLPALEALGEKPCVLKGNPTAENLARLIFEKARAIGLPAAAVRFWETETSMAEYSEAGGGGAVRGHSGRAPREGSHESAQ